MEMRFCTESEPMNRHGHYRDLFERIHGMIACFALNAMWKTLVDKRPVRLWGEMRKRIAAHTCPTGLVFCLTTMRV